MKILCVYALHERTLNVDFFIENGLVDDPEVDYYFVVNDLDLKLEVPNAIVINRENRNYDFGAWSHVLFTNDLYKEYDYFVFINSSLRGPFYPVWYQEKNWIRLFINKLTSDLKLFGTTIGVHKNLPHVQSMLLATDRDGLQIGINKGIFAAEEPQMTMQQVIDQKEVGFSTAILKEGYNIGCMLKAYQGIDFRKTKDLTPGVFRNYDYYGIQVHPYEVIFAKISNKPLYVEQNVRLINQYTNWNAAPVNHAANEFDWLHYLLRYEDLRKAGLRTEKQALTHYYKHGEFEERTPGVYDWSTYYKVDLKGDLFEQLYALVNAILIGHYTHRKILLFNFYAQNDHIGALPIGKIIDIPRLNAVLTQLQLCTYVHDVNLVPIYLKHKINKASKSVCYNPDKNSSDFMEMLLHLRTDKDRFVNLGNTYSDQLFVSLNIFKQVWAHIPFHIDLMTAVSTIKNKLQLHNYNAVHLDQAQLNNYLTEMQWMLRNGNSVLVISHNQDLLNKFQQVHSDIITLDNWRDYVDIYKGRNMDTLIEYLLCHDAAAFLGCSNDVFSQANIWYFIQHQKRTYDAQQKYLEMPQPKLCTVIYNQVHHGCLGLHGELGYTEKDGINTIDVPDYETLSAHAPSTLIIRINEPCVLKGYISPTAKRSPKMTFICNQEIVGTLNASCAYTESYNLESGEYKLEVQTTSKQYAHSVWLLQPAKDTTVSKQFDWRAYIIQYDDLWNAGIRTQQAAEKHYQEYGRKENRIGYIQPKYGSFYMIDLNLTLQNGFINQMIGLTNAIIIGHYTGRSIIVNNFYLNYNSNETHPIAEILDLDHLNSLIAKFGLNTHVESGRHNMHVDDSVYRHRFISGNYLKVLRELHHEKPCGLQLGILMSFIFQKHSDAQISKLYKDLLTHIPFAHKINAIVTTLLEEWNLKQYTAVHLRLEDDIVQHGIDHKMLYHKYVENIKQCRDEPIFIASNLGKQDNQYNYVLTELSEMHYKIITSKHWRVLIPDCPMGREYDAIVDYLVCKKAQKFIGYHGSTFSEALDTDFKRKQKTSILL